MNGDLQRDAALRWWRYAQEDLGQAHLLYLQGGNTYRNACYLAQQSAEKGLKAALVFLQRDFPRTHDHDALRNLLPVEWAIHRSHPLLAELTVWAIEARYPGDWAQPTSVDAEEAVQLAQAVLAALRLDLLQSGLSAQELQGREP